MVVTASLRDPIDVRRIVRTSDGMGGQLETETTVGTVRGRILAQDWLPATAVVAERVGARPRYRAVLAVDGIAIQPSDVLVAGGNRFDVVQVATQGPIAFVLLVGASP